MLPISIVLNYLYDSLSLPLCRTNWEKKPMYLKRNSRYNEGVFSTAELDRILREVSVTDV